MDDSPSDSQLSMVLADGWQRNQVPAAVLPITAPDNELKLLSIDVETAQLPGRGDRLN